MCRAIYLEALGVSPMQYFLKYLTSAPIVAAATLIILATVAIELNYFFPGLQYGTFVHAVP